MLAQSVDGSAAERTAAFFEWETFLRRLPAMTHRMVAALAEVPTDELGEPSLASALSTLLRISKSEAHQRIREAEELGPRAAMTGEPLQPVLTNTCYSFVDDKRVIHVASVHEFADNNYRAVAGSGGVSPARSTPNTCGSFAVLRPTARLRRLRPAKPPKLTWPSWPAGCDPKNSVRR